jgi:hypothetical protein
MDDHLPSPLPPLKANSCESDCDGTFGKRRLVCHSGAVNSLALSVKAKIVLQEESEGSQLSNLRERGGVLRLLEEDRAARPRVPSQ